MSIATELPGKLQRLSQLVPDIQSTEFQAIIKDMQTIEDSQDSDREQARSQIVRVKQRLQQMGQTVENLKTRFADSYRLRLGADKDAFEALDEAAQNRLNSGALADKQKFGRLQEAMDLISEIQGDLLVVDAHIEQESRRSQPADWGTDRTPSDGGADDTPIYDHDPAPPTLSP